jgi:hypothetical protein
MIVSSGVKPVFLIGCGRQRDSEKGVRMGYEETADSAWPVVTLEQISLGPTALTRMTESSILPVPEGFPCLLFWSGQRTTDLKIGFHDNE